MEKTGSQQENVVNFTQKIGQLSETMLRPNQNIENHVQGTASAYDVEDVVDLSGLGVWAIRQKLEALQDSDAQKAADKLQKLGEFFNGSAEYLRQYGGESQAFEGGEPKNVFDKTVGFFDDYGKNLLEEKNERTSEPLSEERKQEIERFLLGDNVYEKRMQQLHKKYGDAIPEDVMENTRKRIVGTFFKALSHDGFSQEDQQQIWKDRKGPFYKLQEKTSEGLSFAAHQPVREIVNFLAQKGGERFLARPDILESGKSLYEAFGLDAVKSELADIQQHGTPEEISQKIISVVNVLSKQVRASFTYDAETSAIKSITKSQKANCAGYTLIGSLLLKELDLPYVLAVGSKHAFTGFTTPDGKFYFNHFQGDGKVEVTDDDLDRVNIEEIRQFIETGSKKVLPVRLSIGTPINWWNNDEGESYNQETVYFYRDIEPGLDDVFRSFRSSDDKDMDFLPKAVLGPENIIDPNLIGGRAGFKAAIERSPYDPKLLDRMSHYYRNEENKFGDRPIIEKMFELTDKAAFSEKKKRKPGFVSRITERLKKFLS